MDTKPTNPKDAIGIAKAPASTVPENVIAEVGVAMLEGALKYGRHNYREAGVRASVYYDACRRHIGAWWEGEDLDPDSEVSHITKAIATLVVLRDSMMRGNWVDDRPPKSAPFYSELNQRAAALLEKYKGSEIQHHTELKVVAHALEGTKHTVLEDFSSNGWVAPTEQEEQWSILSRISAARREFYLRKGNPAEVLELGKAEIAALDDAVLRGLHSVEDILDALRGVRVIDSEEESFLRAGRHPE